MPPKALRGGERKRLASSPILSSHFLPEHPFASIKLKTGLVNVVCRDPSRASKGKGADLKATKQMVSSLVKDNWL